MAWGYTQLLSLPMPSTATTCLNSLHAHMNGSGLTVLLRSFKERKSPGWDSGPRTGSCDRELSGALIGFSLCSLTQWAPDS